ncbi:hypothetical protein GUITHDRAFT_122841 [Guillardia theta CCMP2712]|uniref:Protein kinase domain-containing protein n=1 Tax=Guillardia theta (strain CCMP2712) TaxID=905079 RepID=L1I3X7_GUITC|nr:hypothetical protein GUITHDRAFT_122841 [Guillardia theta CCMP2712]EKX30953.1 hypothetical protein GUITHDRAFT_122841 [Guillardia theta CCMP2712]|eukprot:XP_005817933.1 hypothetical protein GUITHDRAFT_122841 [Guillardia theta CCMP2712]
MMLSSAQSQSSPAPSNTDSLPDESSAECSAGFLRCPSLDEDCPVFLQLASHHDMLHAVEIKRCQTFAIRRSSLTLGDLLGEGSSGEVRSALYNGNEVAVKTLCSKLDARSEEGKDLLKEISMMSYAFRHKNVVEFYGIYEHDGLPWLYYEAKKKSRRDGRWRPKTRRAVSWVEDILSALAYLHAQKPPVIHRDIKPANMLLTGDGRTVKIGDFGLSRRCPHAAAASGNSSPPRPGGSPQGDAGGIEISLDLTATTGTYRYMAPEIFRGEGQYTAAVDVYSFSLVMWYIFAGEHPFCNIDGHSVASMAAKYDFRPSVLSERMMPRELQEMMGRSWAGMAEDRPRAAELLEEIEAWRGRKAACSLSGYLSWRSSPSPGPGLSRSETW